jgi:nucleoside diphosphate kinase
MIKGWLVDFLTSRDVVAMIWEGNAAVKNVRRICGNTLPIMAGLGSIGRFLEFSSRMPHFKLKSIT